MNRITLLTYVITIRKRRPATTKVAMSAPKTAGSIFGKSISIKCREEPDWWGMLEGKLKLPLEPISPASKPTSASRVHCEKRNGCSNCRLVCWKASEIVSTAEIGKMHLGRKAQEQGTANSQVEQSNFWALRASTMAISWKPRRSVTPPQTTQCSRGGGSPWFTRSAG